MICWPLDPRATRMLHRLAAPIEEPGGPAGRGLCHGSAIPRWGARLGGVSRCRRRRPACRSSASGVFVAPRVSAACSPAFCAAFWAVWLALVRQGHGRRSPRPLGRSTAPVLVQIDSKTELADFVCPTPSALLRRQHRVPDSGRTSTLETQPAEIELSHVDPAQQFDPGNCDRCGLKPLKPQHWTDS
jgi:hypothetical protein